MISQEELKRIFRSFRKFSVILRHRFRTLARGMIMNLLQEPKGVHRHWRRTAGALSIAIAALLGRPEAASAAIITVTYTGTAEPVSIDYARIFGPFAVDLAG